MLNGVTYDDYITHYFHNMASFTIHNINNADKYNAKRANPTAVESLLHYYKVLQQILCSK